MSFANAPITKGLMIAFGATSLLVSVFDVKQYANLQLVPHISRYHQYWRLLTHHIVFANSSDLFMGELLLYYVAIHIERSFGSLKYASFAMVSILFSTLLSFLSLLVLYPLGVNYIPAGPFALLFSILYQHYRIVPQTYTFRIIALDFSNKVFVYILALQLVLSHTPGSLVVALIGLASGALYRSDLIGVNSFRLSKPLQGFATKVILPLIGSTRAPRRHNRALPDEIQIGRDRVITTGPSAAVVVRTPTSIPSEPTLVGGEAGEEVVPPRAAAPSVLGQWVQELTASGQTTTLRVPSAAEITQLSTMFPSASRETVIRTLQRSTDVERAVEAMLASQPADT